MKAIKRTTALLESVSSPMIPSLFRVSDIKQEIKSIFTLELEPQDGLKAFPFLPGQFNMLYLFGHGEVPISISGDPGSPEKLVHTISAVGSITRALYRLEIGNIVGVRGPFGNHWPIEDVKGDDILIMAGGIGFAPLRPLVYHLISHSEEYGRIFLLHGVRTPEALLYMDKINQWQEETNIETGVTVDSAGRDWHGSVGLITKLIDRISLNPERSSVFICGPEVMLRPSANILKSLGIESSRIYVSMERNMKCGIGLCGHCQCGPYFICKDGPVFQYNRVETLLKIREV